MFWKGNESGTLEVGRALGLSGSMGFLRKCEGMDGDARLLGHDVLEGVKKERIGFGCRIR